MAITANSTHVLGLVFGHRSAASARHAVERRVEEALLHAAEGLAEPLDLLEVVERLERFAAGERVNLADVPVDLSHLAPFSREVARACQRLGWGEICSYGELAERCGRPGAARAVGSVMAGNRAPLLVPCHRVIGSSGKLGGYSAPGGLATKRKLLDREATQHG